MEVREQILGATFLLEYIGPRYGNHILRLDSRHIYLLSHRVVSVCFLRQGLIV